MMVEIFRSVASRELVFITHVAAVMGVVLGLVQMALYIGLKQVSWADYVMLPVSGMILGFDDDILPNLPAHVLQQHAEFAGCVFEASKRSC